MSRMDMYILVEGVPVLCPDPRVWGEWMATADRAVASDQFTGVWVSTVFLGVDHSFGGDHPILWETMIFGAVHNGYQVRYATREEAIEGHARAVALVGVATAGGGN